MRKNEPQELASLASRRIPMDHPKIDATVERPQSTQVAKWLTSLYRKNDHEHAFRRK